MLKVTDIRTLNDGSGVPVLEIIRERNELLVYESDNTERVIKFPCAAIPTLIGILETLK